MHPHIINLQFKIRQMKPNHFQMNEEERLDYYYRMLYLSFEAKQKESIKFYNRKIAFLINSSRKKLETQ